MRIKRKSHNLDEDLLRRARRELGAGTETDAIVCPSIVDHSGSSGLDEMRYNHALDSYCVSHCVPSSRGLETSSIRNFLGGHRVPQGST